MIFSFDSILKLVAVSFLDTIENMKDTNKKK